MKKMKVGKNLCIATMLLSVAGAVHASAYSYTDHGLDYTIDNTNPLVAKVTFGSAAVSLPGATTSSIAHPYQNDRATATATVTIDSFTLTTPTLGPIGLRILPDGTAVPFASPTIQAQLTGTYSEAWTWDGTSYASHSGAWSQNVSFALTMPNINVWDFPSAAPLLTGFSGLSFDNISLFSVQEQAPAFWEPVGGPPVALGPFPSSIDLAIASISFDQFGSTQFSLRHELMQDTPIPSSVFLFASSLLGLFGVFKRKAA
jgi:hypothetical protein